MWLDDLRPLASGPGPAAAALDVDAFRAFGIAAVDVCGRDCRITESVRARLPYGVMRLFSRPDEDQPRRVLLVPPIAGGYPFLMRDMVVALLRAAAQVAVADWPNARYVPPSAGRFGLAENIAETAQMLRALGPGAHVVGICQGAVPALAAAALLAAEGAAPASVSLIGGPIDASRNPTNLWRVMRNRDFTALQREVIETVPEPYAGAGRKVFPARRQAQAFSLYLWRQTLNGGDLPFRFAFDDGEDPFRFPLARLCWTMMDVPAEFFLENLAAFSGNALAEGRLEVSGHKVDPAALANSALLTVEGADDDIASPGQTAAAQELCTRIPATLRRRLLVPGAGHFALFYGRRMREMVLPVLADTFRAGEVAAARPPAPEAPAPAPLPQEQGQPPFSRMA